MFFDAISPSLLEEVRMTIARPSKWIQERLFAVQSNLNRAEDTLNIIQHLIIYILVIPNILFARHHTLPGQHVDFHPIR